MKYRIFESENYKKIQRSSDKGNWLFYMAKIIF